MPLELSYPHRLRIVRPLNGVDVVIYDALADVQDAGASIPRNMTGQPGKEAEATAFLADEAAGLGIEQYDVVTVTTPDGRVKHGEVSYHRELDGAVLLRLDEYGLTHTVILEHRIETRQPGGRIVVSWAQEPAQPGRLTPVGGDLSLQADQPSAAGDYVLTLRNSSVVTEGDRAWVKGHEDDDRTKPVIWQRRVMVTKVLLPTRSKDRRQSVLAVDVDPEAP